MRTGGIVTQGFIKALGFGEKPLTVLEALSRRPGLKKLIATTSCKGPPSYLQVKSDSQNVRTPTCDADAAFTAGTREITNHRSGAVANHESERRLLHKTI